MANREAVRDWRSLLTSVLLVVAASIFWIVRYPTEFGVSDQEVLLPHLYRLLDPTYLPNDPFLNSGSQHVAFVHVTAFAARFVGLEGALYGARVLSVLLSMSALMVGCRVAGGRARGVFVLLMLLLGTRVFLSVSGYHFLPAFGTPVGLSGPLCFMSLLLLMSQRVGWASVAMFVGALFHPIVASQTLLATCVMQVFLGEPVGFGRRCVRLVPLIVSFLVGAIPLIWYGLTHRSGELSGQEFVHIFCVTRHPHHTVISTWEFNRVARLILVLVLGMSSVGWLMTSEDESQRRCGRRFLAVLVSIAGISLAGYVGIEVLHLKLAAVSYPYRCLVYYKLIGAIVAAIVIAEIIGSEGVLANLSIARMLLGGTTLLTAGLLWCLLPGWQSVVWQVVGAVCLLLVLGCVEATQRGVRVASASGLIVGVVAVSVFGGSFSVVGRLTTTHWNGQETSISEAFAQVDAVVGRDDVVLVTPTIRGFRAFGRRVPYFDWKCFPFEASAAREWYDRYRTLYGRETTLSEMRRFCRDRRIRWILIDMQSHAPEGISEKLIRRELKSVGTRSMWFNGRYALLEIDGPVAPMDYGTAEASAGMRR